MIHQYAQQAASVMGSMASNFQNLARTKADAAAAKPIWDAPEKPAPGSGNIAAGWQRVEVRGLSFSHARGGGFQDVALGLARGERVALIGPSGSGKSTLLRVLAGLYEPPHGYISVDGAAVFGTRTLGEIVTLIPQEAEVFEASVRDNLAFGVEYADDALHRAAWLAQFDNVIASLPQGLDTALSERGSNLSGGQRQRLALARGLLAAQGDARRPPSSLLLLDEPTSALDQLTEARFFRRLREALPDTTILATVHRLALLEHFDRVVLMAEGRMLDEGTPSELAERQPLFREMLRDASEQPAPVRAA
jgi:ABC-type multidrug transport system fused ATPase/permease subunit